LFPPSCLLFYPLKRNAFFFNHCTLGDAKRRATRRTNQCLSSFVETGGGNILCSLIESLRDPLGISQGTVAVRWSRSEKTFLGLKQKTILNAISSKLTSSALEHISRI
jgi:hypothetical protein